MLAAGSTINGRYRLTSLIGEGGMASVWRAHDETLQRDVAIKLLYLQYHGDPQAGLDQFLREARIAAAVQHRHVIHTVDFGTSAEGIPFMVMELLQGESLAARMERAPALTLEAWLQLTELMLRGLSAVHDAGIVHRDLKPQNIFLQHDGDGVYPKILDFGISRSVGAGSLVSPVATQQGMVIGSLYYMAPEQARGEAQIDKRADIYSLGAIMYEGLSGCLPFDAATPGELLVKVISGEPTPLHTLRPDLPQPIVHCVAQAMARDRQQRFLDAKAFRSALLVAVQQSFAGMAATWSVDTLASATAPVALQQKAAGWGDFEGLATPALRAAPAPVVIAAAVSQRAPAIKAAAPKQRGSSAGRTPPPPRASNATSEGATIGGEALLGDNPLDIFAGANGAELELDPSVGHLAAAPGRRVSNVGAQRVPSRRPHAGVVTRESRTSTRRPPRTWVWWILPSVLALLLAAFILQPRLLSLAPPDRAAALARQAKNPATRGSSRTLQSTTLSAPTDTDANVGREPLLRELLE